MTRIVTAAAVVGAGLVAVELSAAAPAQAFVATDVQRAYQYAASVHVHSGVAVLDTKTGQFWGAGDYGGATFASESIIKAFIAARLLVTGQMSGATAAVAFKMITQSDDASANALYGRVGGDSLINWVKAYYHIPFLGTPPSRPGWWGNTHVTPSGYVYFLAKAKADPKVGPWLLNAMHQATAFGSDGFNQTFGIPQATTGAAVKQGWGNDDDAANSTELNSTGFVQGDRYAVALFAQHIPAITDRYVRDTINEMARRTLPGGRINNPADHNPVAHVDAIYATGNTLTLRGWAFDPDISASSMIVSVFEGSVRTQNFFARTARPDVNRIYRVTGNHGFNVTFLTADGTHDYCVEFTNVSVGTASPRACYRIRVGGAPTGHFDTAAITSDNIGRLSGWAFDPDAPAGPIRVAVTDNGVTRATFVANGSRPDVNAALHISGGHGFTVTLPAGTGGHTYCVSALDVGPIAHPNVSLGCKVAIRAVPEARAKPVPATPTRAGGSSSGSASPSSSPSVPSTSSSASPSSSPSVSSAPAPSPSASSAPSTSASSAPSTSASSTPSPSASSAAPSSAR